MNHLMLRMLAGLVVCLPVLSHAQKSAIDIRTMCASMATYLDDSQRAVQDGLARIAKSPEAAGGDWSAIEPLLQQLANEQQLKGAWLFIKPDGSYYSLGKGLTSLSVSDRPYFQVLFSGGTISGYPLYSRSTGKKSAFFAAPVIVDGRVNGAIAASIFLDDWHGMVQQKFNLPSDITWFVVNWKGEVVLDRDTEFIFANAIEQGSPSLQQGIKRMGGKETGNFDYEIGGVSRSAVFNALNGIEWRLVLAKLGPADVKTAVSQQMTMKLEKIRKDLQVVLNRIDGEITAAIAPLQRVIKDPQEARPVLAEIAKANQLAVDVAFVTTNDVLAVIEPPDYRSYEGSSIADSKRTELMRQKKGPVLTDAFTSVEGMTAVSLSYPVYNEQGDLAGTVSVMLNPGLIFKRVLGSRLSTELELWAMQKDGKIIHDANEEEIGRMLFSDPFYAGFGNLLELGRQMVEKPAGQGNYFFKSATTGEDVVKVAEWDTISLHGTEWRVVLVRRPYDK